MTDDVPSPIDFRQMPDAQAWEQTAMSKRPYRTEFFARFAAEIAAAPNQIHRVLDLGSGPGFLAKSLLEELPKIVCTLLDFSPAMLELARRRITTLQDRAEFIERDFKKPDWFQGLGSFQGVVTLQAVHELRHKRHASELHAGVREILEPGGLYLVCDHFAGDGGMQNRELYMTVEEQSDRLKSAGFARIDQVLVKGGLALLRAFRPT